MKVLKELHAQVWTVLGVALVLITLTGETLSKAAWAFGISLVIHFAGALLTSDDDNNT
jgi:hypothetical protein